MKVRPSRGSHLPVLMKLMSITNGPVLELGSGMYSSTYLHWACFPNRRLITYEDNKDWLWFADRFKAQHHEVNFVEDWDRVDFSTPFSVALVDHDPKNGRVRAQEVARLTHVDYVVCHDSEDASDKKYRYSTISQLFQHRAKYIEAGFPHTTVFSNKHKLDNL